MSKQPVVERKVEQDGRQFLIQVFSIGGRYVATTRFDPSDVIEIDGFSIEEAMDRCCRLLPLAVLTREIARPEKLPC